VFYCFIFIIHIHYSLNSSIKSINLFSFQSTCNLYCPISQQKLLCSYVRQKNISILMIVIKRLWASVFHNIIIEENLKSKSVLSYFCKNLLIKLSMYTLTLHYTEPPGKPKSTEPLDYMVRHFLWNWSFLFNSKTSQNADSLKHHYNFLLELTTKYIVAHIFYIYIKFRQYEQPKIISSQYK